MITRYSQEEFDSALSRTRLPLECSFCHQIYLYPKHLLMAKLKNKTKVTFCSHSCSHLAKLKRIEIECQQCQTKLSRTPGTIKSKNVFCSSSCAGSYNTTHKKHGTRRSKLEVYLEQKIGELFPNLEIIYNNKETINSELDIYIPSLKLAFELNGIFHYEPIYGADKLSRIQNNDNRKFQACLEKEIELCIIDSSKLSYFKPEKAQCFLDIITQIIKTKLAAQSL